MVLFCLFSRLQKASGGELRIDREPQMMSAQVSVELRDSKLEKQQKVDDPL